MLQENLDLDLDLFLEGRLDTVQNQIRKGFYDCHMKNTTDPATTVLQENRDLDVLQEGRHWEERIRGQIKGEDCFQKIQVLVFQLEEQDKVLQTGEGSNLIWKIDGRETCYSRMFANFLSKPSGIIKIIIERTQNWLITSCVLCI